LNISDGRRGQLNNEIRAVETLHEKIGPVAKTVVDVDETQTGTLPFGIDELCQLGNGSFREEHSKMTNFVIPSY
jgi:hypothetical protein